MAPYFQVDAAKYRAILSGVAFADRSAIASISVLGSILGLFLGSLRGHRRSG